MEENDGACPNPLFEQWLKEWRDEAANKGHPNQYLFSKALKNLRKCPLRLNRGKDCMIVKHFGEKLCLMLDKKLDVYIKSIEVTAGNGSTSVSQIPKTEEEGSIEEEESIDEEKSSEEASNRPYIPEYGTDQHAILTTMYMKMQKPDYCGFMLKEEIITACKKNSLSPIRKGSSLKQYVGWCSMNILIKRNLVEKYSRPLKYRLTSAGIDLAKSLVQKRLKCLSTKDKHERYDNLNILRKCTATSNSSLDDENSTELPPLKNGHESISTTSSKVNKEDEIVLLDSEDDDDVFTNNAKVLPDNMETDCSEDRERKESACSEEAFNEYCKENEEPMITVRKKKHFIFSEPPDFPCTSNKPNSRNEKIDFDQENIDEIQPKSSPVKKKNDEKRKEKDSVINNKKQKTYSTDTPTESFFLLANNFDILLLVDTQETSGSKSKPKDDPTVHELNKLEILYEVRSLKVGDFAWIARCRLTNKELVLPYIIERKRIDDLGSSIKDGRYHEQKFRLRQSGIKNIIYMIESYNKNYHGSIPLTSLLQASVNSLIQDSFIVKYTKDHKNSMRYLATMTTMLTKLYEGKELISCRKKDLEELDVNADSYPERLMEFTDFNKSSIKTKNFRVREMFIRQLLQLKGVSLDKAVAITELYPTPKILAKAFEKSGDTLLADITGGPTKRKIGPAISKTLHQFYTRPHFS